MMITSKLDEFLNNKANKQRFIHYLSDNLDTVERERGEGTGEEGREGGREGDGEREERESWKHCRSCKR